MRKIDTIVGASVLLTLVSLAGSCSSTDTPSSKAKDFALANGGMGWTWSVSLNGIPLLWEEPGGGLSEITLAVRNGENRLSVKAKRDRGEPVSSARLRVLLMTSSGQPTTDAPIVDLAIEPGGGSDTYEKTVTFNAAIPFTWAWETAESISSLSEVDRRSILSTIHEMQSALARQDWKACDKLRQAYCTDRARYHGVSSDDTAREVDGRLKKAFEVPAHVEGRKETELNFVCSGQVVYVCGKEAPWVIRVIPEADNGVSTQPAMPPKISWTFGPFLFAKIRGQWVIVN